MKKYFILFLSFTINNFALDATLQQPFKNDFLLLSNIQQHNEVEQQKEENKIISKIVKDAIADERKQELDTKRKEHPTEAKQPAKKQKNQQTKPDSSVFGCTELCIPISIESKSEDIKNIINLISKLANIDIVIDEDISGKVGSLSLKDSTLGTILKYICLQNQLYIHKEMGILRILKKSKFNEENKKEIPKHIATEKSHTPEIKKYKQHAFDLKYTNLTDDLKAHTEKSWKAITGDDKNTMLAIDQETKRIYVRGSENQIKEFKNFLDYIDQAQIKVKIDMVLLATDKTRGLNLGINWSGIYNRQGSNNIQRKGFNFVGVGGRLLDFPTPTSPVKVDDVTYGNLYVNPENLAVNLFTSAFETLATFIKIPFVFGGPDLNLKRLNFILNAAEAENKTKILAKPTLLVTNNQVAKVLVGQSVPIYTTVQDVVQSSVRSLSTINYKDVGISIQVKPVVSKDRKTISLDIYLEASEIVSGGTAVNDQGINENPPVLLLVKLKNNVVLENGQTTIIGGIIQTREQKSMNMVPYLHKLPLIGSIFKSELNSKEEQEDILFVTPTIIE